MRSETLPIDTPSIARSFSTISSPCATEEAATVTSIRSASRPEAVTSRPVTDPPEDSTAVVIALTALPRAGTSSRTVIELETLGTVAIDASFFRLSRRLNILLKASPAHARPRSSHLPRDSQK